MSLRDLLLRIFWKKEKAIIEIVDRIDGKVNIKTISSKDITYVGKGHFNYGRDDTYIPFHRVLFIRKNGKIIWRKPSIQRTLKDSKKP
ncbi:MAG: DUF504 domain-containing protein [Candidatus Aenigmarchaeota archaeon]|nr:DUF504 domain-containing protein [Candidatus Aenigmarchaeota archaeon]